MRQTVLVPILLAVLAAPLPAPDDRPWPSGAAWADNGDDDDDDGHGRGNDDDDDRRGNDDDDDRADDDDDDGGPPPTRPDGPLTAPTPPPPTAAPAEIVAFALSAADYQALLALGYELIEEQTIAAFGTTLRRLRVPQGVSLVDARATVRALPSGQDADFNHYYRTEQADVAACEGPHCPAFDLIDWPLPPSRANPCGKEVAIGMIDTGINPGQATFDGGWLEIHRLTDDALEPSRAIHGTAVAAILIGDPQSQTPGLVPYARLVAVDAFSRAGSDERADAFTLVEGLGLLAARDVAVINLSLAGPPNTVLERAIAELVEGFGIVLVAAAGNDGPQAGPLYPAAYPGVIAVTAVDRNGVVYRRAGRGPHVDIAAPGVEVWTAASVSGAQWKTGTSFAAPFVSAAAALVLQEALDLTPAEVAETLGATARDLGPPGRDDIYGHGLLSLSGICRIVWSMPAVAGD